MRIMSIMCSFILLVSSTDIIPLSNTTSPTQETLSSTISPQEVPQGQLIATFTFLGCILCGAGRIFQKIYCPTKRDKMEHLQTLKKKRQQTKAESQKSQQSYDREIRNLEIAIDISKQENAQGRLLGPAQRSTDSPKLLPHSPASLALGSFENLQVSYDQLTE